MKRNKLNRKFRRNLIISLMTLNMVLGMQPVMYGEDLKEKYGFAESNAELEALEEEFKAHKAQIKVKKLLEERKKLDEDFCRTLHDLSDNDKKDKIKKNLEIEEEIQKLKGITRDALKGKYGANMLDKVYDALPPKEKENTVAGGPPIAPPLQAFQAVPQDKKDIEYAEAGKTDVKYADIETARNKLNDVNNKKPNDPFSADDLEALKTFGIGGKKGKRLFELKKKQFEEQQNKNAKELEKATNKYLKLKQKQHADLAKYDKDGVLGMDAQVEKALLPLSIDNKAQFLNIIKAAAFELDKNLMSILTKNEKELNNDEGGFAEDTLDISIPKTITKFANWTYNSYVVMPNVSGLFAEQKKEIDTYVRDYLKKNNYRRATIKFGKPSVAIGHPNINPDDSMAVPKPMITSATVTFCVPRLKLLHDGKPFCTMQKIELPILIGQYDPMKKAKRHNPVVQIGTTNTQNNIRLLTKELFEIQYNLLNNPTKIKNGIKVKTIEDTEKDMEKNLFNISKHFEAFIQKYGIMALKNQTTITDPFKKKIIEEKEEKTNCAAISDHSDEITKRMALFEKTNGKKKESYASEIWKIVEKVKKDFKKEFDVNQNILEAGLDSGKNKDGTTLRSLFNVPIDQPFEFSKIRFGFFGQHKGQFYYGDPAPEDKAIYNSIVTAAVQDANWQVKKDGVVPHKDGLQLLKKELLEYKKDLGNNKMPKDLSKNQVMNNILENQIGILQPRMSKIEKDVKYNPNDPTNKLKQEHDALIQQINFLRHLKNPATLPIDGVLLPPDKKKDTLDTILAKVENDLKIFEVNVPNKNAFDEIKQKVQERIDSLEKNGTDNVNIAYSNELDDILTSVSNVLLEKIQKTKNNKQKNKYKGIQVFVASSKRTGKFDPALPNYIVGNPRLNTFKELYQLILLEIDKITDIPQQKLLEDKHKAEELLKKAEEFGMDINDELKNQLGIQDEDIHEFEKLQDEKKKLEEENQKLKEKTEAQNAYKKDYDMLKQLRQQKRDAIIRQKIDEAKANGQDLEAEYKKYAGDPNNKKSMLEWYIERFNLTDKEIDKLLVNEGKTVKIKGVDERLKAIEDQKKLEEEAKRQKEEDERKKQEEELNKQIAEQQKKLDEEKQKLEDEKKKTEENVKLLETMIANPDDYRKEFYKDEAKAEEEAKDEAEDEAKAEEEARKKAEEEEARKKAEEEEARKKAEEEEARKKAEEEEARKKAEEKAKEEAKDEAEAKAEKENKEEEEEKDKKTDDGSTSTSSTKSSDDLNFAQALQAALQLSKSEAENQSLKDKIAELEAEKKNQKTDPAMLKMLENQTALLSQLLKQNSEKQKTTTEKVATGVAKTVVPTATMASAVPLAMKFMPRQEDQIFNDAVARFAAQGVKLAPNMLQNAPQALAENALPQVVEAGKNVTGG